MVIMVMVMEVSNYITYIADDWILECDGVSNDG